MEKNICAECGGAIALEYTIVFERCLPHEIRVAPDLVPSPFRLCPGHPKLEREHDGNLDTYEHARHVVCHFEGEGITIEVPRMEKCCRLDAQQALSLLSLLEQKRDMLEHWAKDNMNRSNEKEGASWTRTCASNAAG